MSSTHKIDATIGVGDPDLGAEVEARISFTFQPNVPEQGPSYASGGQPAEPAHAEWVSAERLVNGEPRPFDGVFWDMEKSSFDAIAEAWLESDEGQCQAIEHAMDELQRDDEAAADAKAEARRDDW